MSYPLSQWSLIKCLHSHFLWPNAQTAVLLLCLTRCPVVSFSYWTTCVVGPAIMHVINPYRGSRMTVCGLIFTSPCSTDIILWTNLVPCTSTKYIQRWRYNVICHEHIKLRIMLCALWVCLLMWGDTWNKLEFHKISTPCAMSVDYAIQRHQYCNFNALPLGVHCRVLCMLFDSVLQD